MDLKQYIAINKYIKYRWKFAYLLIFKKVKYQSIALVLGRNISRSLVQTILTDCKFIFSKYAIFFKS